MAENHGYDPNRQGQSSMHVTAAQPAVESAAAADEGATAADASGKQAFSSRRCQDRPLFKMSVDLIETYKQINKVRPDVAAARPPAVPLPRRNNAGA